MYSVQPPIRPQPAMMVKYAPMIFAQAEHVQILLYRVVSVKEMFQGNVVMETPVQLISVLHPTHAHILQYSPVVQTIPNVMTVVFVQQMFVLEIIVRILLYPAMIVMPVHRMLATPIPDAPTIQLY